jgi:CRP-like cAMP-binding protein
VVQQRSSLGENRLLQRLTAGDFSQLEPQLKKMKLDQGDVLHPAGEPIGHVYFPISGMVSMLTILKTGRAVEIAVVGREGVVGGSIAAEGSRSFAQATVHMSGEAFRVAAAPFLKLFEASREFRKRINGYQSVLALQTQQSAACHAVHTVEERLARWLLHAQDTVDQDTIDLTQEFFADRLGVQRSSVSLTAHALQKAGLIRYSRGRIKILDREGIEECACECYEVVRREIDRVSPRRKST